MSAPALTQPSIADTWRSVRSTAILLGLGIVVLGLLFPQEIAAAIGTWIDSTAYNHCFLVLPIVGYLIWDRRDTLRGAVAEPVPWVALAGIPIAIAWLLAERLGIMEGRQLMAMSFVELLFLAVLGWRLWWLLSGPLLYLYFLVPFGDFVTPKLQDFTTDFVRHGLDVLHIPAYIDGFTIQIPEGTFYIATACAGLRFLIASIAFGCLYALLIYRSPLRRTVFIVASIIVPVIANGFRALGIVVLGHVLGSAQAAATDHILYGWIFFSLVILVLIALGLPLREDQAARPVPPAVERRHAPGVATMRNVMLACGIVVVLAAVSPAVAMMLNSAGATPTALVPPIDFGPGCTETAMPAPAALDARSRMVARRVACPDITMDVNIAVFSRHSTAGPPLAQEHQLLIIRNAQQEEDSEVDWLPVSSGEPRVWRMKWTQQAGPMLAFLLFVDGRPAPSWLGLRTHMAWSSLVGARIAPVLVMVEPEADRQMLDPRAREALEKRLGELLSRPGVLAQLGRLGAS